MIDAPTEIREKRSGVIIRAAIMRDDAVVERRVRNLSSHGACVDNVQDLTEGDVVRVSMGSVRDVVADVVWAKPQLAGLRFRDAVDLEDARKPRTATTTPTAGWIAEIDNPYRGRR